MRKQNIVVPAQASPPGLILSKELDRRNISQADLAEIMDRPAKTLNAIIQGKKEITAQTAVELEQALDIPASIWLNLESDYQLQLHKMKATHEETEKERMIAIRSRIYSLAPVRELLKKGWIHFTEDVKKNANILSEYLEEDIMSSNIKSKVAQFSANFRHSTKMPPQSEALYAWTCRAKSLAKQQGQYSYDENGLRKNIEELKNFVVNESDVSKIPAFLKQYGVHFLLIPHLQKTYLDGAMIMYEDQVIVALTLRHDRIDNFYFSLFHELGHLLLGHGEDGSVFLDSIDSQDKTDIKEQAADRFAESHLLQQELMNKFCELNTSFPREVIEDFAHQAKLHPGIVLGQLQHRGLVSYGHQRQMLSKVKHYLDAYIDAV